MSSYNWEAEQPEIFFLLKDKGYDPTDDRLKDLLRKVFDRAWWGGYYVGKDEGYDECLVEYHL